MDIKLTMKDVKVQSGLEDMAKHCLQIAATKGWEQMVARLPAASQTKYSTGQLRMSTRVEKTGDKEYTYYVQMPYGIYVEFGTGPKGRETGAWPEFPNDPYPSISYHQGEVLVTRWRGRMLEVPYVRHTQGMVAQPFLRPGLVYAMDFLIELLKKHIEK